MYTEYRQLLIVYLVAVQETFRIIAGDASEQAYSASFAAIRIASS